MPVAALRAPAVRLQHRYGTSAMQRILHHTEPRARLQAPWINREAALRNPASDNVRQSEAGDVRPTRGTRIVCRQCLQLITIESERIEIGGAHQHTFANPAGLLFQIGCFGSAQGCAPAGPPETRWSWFAGYRWQAVLCSSCLVHLGWRYTGAAGTFYGLILHRLLQEN